MPMHKIEDKKQTRNRRQAYLEGKPCAEHEDQNELKVLVDGPQGLHSALSIGDKECESCWR